VRSEGAPRVGRDGSSVRSAAEIQNDFNARRPGQRVSALTLLASAATAVAAALVFLHVGRRFWAREGGDAATRRASRLFALWWFAVGAYALGNGVLLNLLAAFGSPSLRLAVTVRTLSLPVLAVGLTGLTYHLAYLLTGRERALRWVAAYFSFAYAAATYLHAVADPVGVRVGAWGTELVYVNAPPLPQMLAVWLLVLGPLLAASLAYVGVGLRLREPDRRRRALLVGHSLALWLAGLLASNVSEDDTLRFIARPVLGLAAAGAVLLAYRERGPNQGSAERMSDIAERAKALV
jgi:hypothetical protein